MVAFRRRLPPYIRSFWEDLFSVSRSIFAYFVGSLILWVFALVLSLLFIPLTQLCRRLVLICSVPCMCNRSGWCRCRVSATSVETSWIRSSDKVMTHREFRAKLQKSLLLKKTVIESDAEVGVQAVPLLPSAGLGSLGSKDSAKDVTPSEPQRSLIGNIHSLVLVVEKSLDIEKLIKTIERRIVNLDTPDSNGRYFPRITQCLVSSACGVLVWADDPLFSISKQIIRHEIRVSDQADLEALLADKAREGLPTDRPLWQLIIATGYGSLRDTVLIWRFHGAMYDGPTIAKILAFSLATPHNITFKANSQYYSQANHIIKFILQGPMKFISLLIKRKPWQHDRVRVSSEPKPPLARAAVYHGWTERTLSLPLLLKNKMLLNMTCNDILLSLITGASLHVSTQFEESSIHMLRHSTSILIPFDLWTDLNKVKTLPQGNCMRMVPCPLRPVSAVIPRLWRIEHNFTRLKKSGDIRTEHYVMSWLHLFPFTQGLCRRLHARLRGDCTSLITSFNGPNTSDSIDGASIRDIMYFAHPPQGVKYSYNFMMYSGLIKLTTLSTTSKKLTSKTVDQLVINMSKELKQVNTMVFDRYFPDGLSKAVCPYGQPQASRLFAQFMKKLQDIDSSCEVTNPAVAPSEPENPSTPFHESSVVVGVSNGSPQVLSKKLSSPARMPKHLIYDEVDLLPSPSRRLSKSLSANLSSPVTGGLSGRAAAYRASASLSNLQLYGQDLNTISLSGRRSPTLQMNTQVEAVAADSVSATLSSETSLPSK